MIDEFDNDVPYDFKNILFKGKEYAKLLRYGSYWDASMTRLETSDTTIDGVTYYAFSFNIPSGVGPSGPDEIYYTKTLSVASYTPWYAVSENVAIVTNNVKVTIPQDLTLGTFYYTFSASTKDASLGGTYSEVHDNVIKNWMEKNSYRYYVQKLNYNIFVHTGSLTCFANIIGFNSHYNTFTDCNKNTFGDNCYHNVFGFNYCGNVVGTSFLNNIIGTNFESNSFGDLCQSNTFGGYCQHNKFGYYFAGNTFGDNCAYNIFGDSAIANKFGNYCEYNTFGNNVVVILFGNYCCYNTFGTACRNITFGDSASMLINYCQKVIIDSKCSYLCLTSSDASASSGNYLQNIHIHLGIQGTSSESKTVIVDRNLAYETDAYQDENGNIIYKKNNNERELSYQATMDILNSILMPEGTAIENNNATLPEGSTVTDHNVNL